MKTCLICGEQCSTDALTCPKCGEGSWSPWANVSVFVDGVELKPMSEPVSGEITPLPQQAKKGKR